MITLAQLVMTVSVTGASFWVDSSARDGGEGTRDKPWRELQAALEHLPAEANTLHLAPGIYEGPFALPPATKLDGAVGTVLSVGGDGTVVTTSGEAQLARLAIRGGKVGVLSVALTELEEVAFEAQVASSIDVTTGELRARGLRVHALAQSHVMRIGPGAKAQVRDAQVWGALRRAFQIETGAKVRLTRVMVAGSEVAVHAKGAELELDGMMLVGQRGPAIFLGGGVAKLTRIDVMGHEYALLARGGARVMLDTFTSFRAERAGLGLVEAQVEASHVQVLDSGNLGGIQGVGGQVVLDHFDVVRAQAYGMIFVGTSGRLSNGTLLGVRRDVSGEGGNALHFNRSRAEVFQVQVRGAQGACIVASEGSRLVLDELQLTGCELAGVEVLGNSQVLATRIALREGARPIATVGEQSQLALDQWTVWPGGAEPKIRADCGQGVVLFGGRMETEGASGLEVSCSRRFQDRPTGFAR